MYVLQLICKHHNRHKNIPPKYIKSAKYQNQLLKSLRRLTMSDLFKTCFCVISTKRNIELMGHPVLAT